MKTKILTYKTLVRPLLKSAAETWTVSKKMIVSSEGKSFIEYMVQYRIKIFNYNYCTICKLKNIIMDKDHLLVCPKLDHTSKELPKLYWDARRLMK